MAMKKDFRELGKKLKKKTSRLVFLEILPQATPGRQRELRELDE